MNQLTVTLYYPVTKITNKAILLQSDLGLTWIPRSQLLGAYKRKSGDVTEYKTIIPYWLAEKEGFLATDGQGYYKYISSADINE